jgi:hypothetical protein
MELDIQLNLGMWEEALALLVLCVLISRYLCVSGSGYMRRALLL